MAGCSTSVREESGEGTAEVRVFYADIREFRPAVAVCEGLLCTAERERLRTISAPLAREQFVTARALLRGLLARQLGIGPRDVDFFYGAAGKPMLKTVSGGAPAWFNLAHSREIAVLALGADGPVGIDVEWVDPAQDVSGLAALAWGDANEQLPVGGREFYRRWVRFEAARKLDGSGVFAPEPGARAEARSEREFTIHTAAGEFAGCVMAAGNVRIGEGRWLHPRDLWGA